MLKTADLSPREAAPTSPPFLPSLAERYQCVRNWTHHLCEPLVTEDYVVQSMPDVSPAKWHLAHTSWFFETFLLKPRASGYQPFDPAYTYLFNSYYLTIGDRHCRQNRGLLSRPTVESIYAYRRHVDKHMIQWLAEMERAGRLGLDSDLRPIIELGLHHEQQHQELMLTDIKHVFWVNPLRPAYHPAKPAAPGAVPPMRWIMVESGLRSIGHEGAGFAFDNETPRHRVFLEGFQIASRLVTNGEYQAFIDDGGYRRGDLWLSAGWAAVQRERWHAPLYGIEQDGQRWLHTLAGPCRIGDGEPVCHVSYFEADAYARWAGARLASEAEWEVASEGLPLEGNFAESESFHPIQACHPENAAGPAAPRQMFGDVWEWTRSAYSPYPGYQPAPGALGEYNGKFMCNQFVLRGGSCATPASHIRPTYRNFFPPDARWQFTGIRLAKDA